MKRLAKQNKFFYGYIIIVILWFIYFSNVTMLLYGVPALNAKMLLQTDMDATMVGYASSFSLVVQGLAGPIVGMMIRKQGPRRPFIIGSLFLVIGAVLISMYAINEIRYILLYGILIGLGLSLGGIMTSQSTVNIWFNRRQAFAMALLLSSGGVGGFIAPLLLDNITDYGTWTDGWILIAGLCGCSLLISVVVLINRPDDICEVPDGKAYIEKQVKTASVTVDRDINKGTPMAQVCRSPAFYGIIGAYSTRNAIYFAITGYLVIYLTGTGIDSTSAALSLSIFSVSSLIGRFAVGFVDESLLPPRVSVAGCNILMGMGAVLLQFVSAVPATFGCVAIMGIGLGMGYVGMPLCISRYFGSDNFSVVNGLISPINYLMGALGPLAVAKIGNYVWGFNVIGIVAILGGMALLIIKPPVYS